jgi:hypothetical protein
MGSGEWAGKQTSFNELSGKAMIGLLILPSYFIVPWSAELFAREMQRILAKFNEGFCRQRMPAAASL